MRIETDSERFVNVDDGLLDVETGEIIQVDEDGKIQKAPKEPAWFKGIKSGFRQLSKIELQAADLRVAINLFGRVKYGNKLSINQSKLAEELNMNRTTVSLSLKKLQEQSIIRQVGRSPTGMDYMIERAYCWCGNNQKEREGK